MKLQRPAEYIPSALYGPSVLFLAIFVLAHLAGAATSGTTVYAALGIAGIVAGASVRLALRRRAARTSGRRWGQ